MDLTLGEQILILIRQRGPLTAEEIASYLGRGVDEVKEELNYLELDKLVMRVRRGVIFKREAYDLTPTGLEEAEKAYEKLRAKAQEIVSKINALSPEEFDVFINQYMSIIPLLLLLNLIPLEFLLLMGLSPELIELSTPIDENQF